MKNGLMNRIKDVLAGLTGKNRFEKMDFVLLKTTPMLAAVDGKYSEIERDCILALEKKVKAARARALAERYPQGAKFDK